MTGDELAFWVRHFQTKGGVVVVELYADEEHFKTGIFSTWKAANDWVENAERHDDQITALFIPYILDVPEFGEMTKEELC